MDAEPGESPQTERLLNSSTVTFPAENEKVAVSIGNVNALFTDIARYNDQFSMPSQIVGLFHSLMDLNEGKGELSEVLSKGAEQTQMLTASGINLVHEPVLNKLGLQLEPVSGKKGALYGMGQKAEVGEMRINIKDGRRFLSFLQALSPDAISETELKENLHSLSDTLAQQIFNGYDLKDPSDEALQLFGSLESIVNEYNRLHIAGTERLETYLMHSKRGDLREFILVQSQGLLSEPGKYFGPADWQKDASPEYLNGRWDTPLAILKMARENPKAQELYHQLFNHLSNCLKIAQANLETLDYLSEERKAELRKILQGIEEAFG